MNFKNKVLILGSYEFAEEVADLVQLNPQYELAGFVENQDRARCSQVLGGAPILWVDDIAPLAATHLVVCAIGTTKRITFISAVEQLGFEFAIIKHPAAQIFPSAKLESGCIVGAGVIIAAQATIGQHVILNRGVLIGHHTKIGNYVTVSPGANIAGRIEIGERAYIGMGAVILNDLKIGAGSVVGAGAVVTRHVPARTLVVGHPATIAKENIDGL